MSWCIRIGHIRMSGTVVTIYITIITIPKTTLKSQDNP